MWNLPVPPGFQGLHPDKPVTAYYRHLPHWRQDGATYFVTFRLGDALPQSKLDELAALKAEWERRYPAFLTSRVMPRRMARRMALQSRPALRPLGAKTARESHPTWGLSQVQTALESRPTVDVRNRALEELARAAYERIEAWLDQGIGSCVLKGAVVAKLVIDAMHHFDGSRYELACYVVMHNHVHAIVRPLLPDTQALEAIIGSWKKYSARRINPRLGITEHLWQAESYDRIIRDGEHLCAIQYVGSNPERAGLSQESCARWIRPEWVELGWRFE